MISIYGYNIALPPRLAFLAGDLGSFVGTFIGLIALAFIAYYLIFILLKLGFSWTDTEADDVILDVTRWPFIFFSILFSLERSIEIFGREGWVGNAERILWALMAIVITYWISELLKNVALFELERYSRSSEAAWDDVLAPVLKRIVPPIIWIIGLIIFLQDLGLNLTGLYVTLGGAAFILGFALQDVLSNLFSGLVLLMDTPFQFGDVVQLENGTVAVVKDIGLRVTHFYNTKDHSDIYIPNSVLGGMAIVNITRPTTDLAASVSIGVAYTADAKYNGYDDKEKNITKILERIIFGHPDVFGDIDKKIGALEYFSQFVSGQEKINKAKKRLEIENRLNETLGKLERQLGQFAELASRFEKNGLDIDEEKELKQVYSDILSTAGLTVLSRRKSWVSSKKPHLEEGFKEDGDKDTNLFRLVRDWYRAWLLDPDLVREDTDNLREEWEQKLLFLKIKLERLHQYVTNPTGHERRLDFEAKNIVDWIHSDFKESRVLWKDPDIRLVNFGASSLDFEISYYVDNIKLEHYERTERIQDELKREIKFRFDEAGIEIPFPQTDIWFRNLLKTHNNNA